MTLGPPAQTIMNMAPSVGHIVLAFAALDTMMALTIEMVRPICEAEGTALKRARETGQRLKELRKAFDSPSVAPWRKEGHDVIKAINELKVVRDLLAHGQLDINNLGVADSLYFTKVNPNKDRSAQEAEVLAIDAPELKKQATAAVTLQARFLTLIARMSERPGGWKVQ